MRFISNNKKIFIGADEAGYGPNLGPLVIAATVWSAPAEMHESQLSEAFAKVCAPRPWTLGCTHVPLGDSKKLYQSGSGLATLEAGLLAMLGCQGGHQGTLAEMLTEHASPFLQTVANSDVRERLPWYAGLEQNQIPATNLAEEEISRLSASASQALKESYIELVAVRAVVVHEIQFNTEVARLGSKGQLLSQVTLQLVAQLLEEFRDPAQVFCDRQGGRKNYLPILLDAMPSLWFHESLVSHARCSYRTGVERPIDIHFSVGGDRFPPTALASMCAKYLRERCMEAFNSYWLRHLPDIKPTAGYPSDAKRFYAQIERIATELGISSDDWWRSR